MDIYGNISTIWYPLVVATSLQTGKNTIICVNKHIIELHGQSIPFQSVKLPEGKQNGWLVFMLIGWLTI
jgi:hypothetical protein